MMWIVCRCLGEIFTANSFGEIIKPCKNANIYVQCLMIIETKTNKKAPESDLTIKISIA